MVRPPPKSTRTDTLFPYTTLFRSLGQTIIVDNKAGANGNIATSLVARAAPDGSTLFVTSIGHAVNPAMYTNVTYNPVKDYTPLVQVLTAPNVMVVTITIGRTSGRERVFMTCEISVSHVA